MPQPGNADPLARLQPGHAGPQPVDPPDDFMARNDRITLRRQFAIQHVQIGPADAAGANAHADLSGLRLAVRQFRPDQFCAGFGNTMACITKLSVESATDTSGDGQRHHYAVTDNLARWNRN